MNNEINENAKNKNIQKQTETEGKNHFFKINVIKPKENVITQEKKSIQNQNLNKLFLSPVKKRKKSKNDNELKNILENSFRTKKSYI